KRDFVDQPRDEALRIAQAPAAAKTSGLTWRLGDVADLKDATNDPLVLRASECIAGTLVGQQLITELKKRIKTRPPLTVQGVTNPDDMADGQKELAGVSHVDGKGLHGFTRPVSLKPFRIADFDQIEPNLHFVVGIKTLRERSNADNNKESDFLQFSDPVRLLSMAETIFHEFLHASTVAATAREKLGIQRAAPEASQKGPFLEADLTGHGDDTSFEIDPFKLQLITDGQIDPSFKQRLEAFVREVVDTFQLRKKLEAERAQ